MELRDFARAIASRWVWPVAGAAVGILLAGIIGSLAPTAYQSTVTLYVGAARVAAAVDDDPGYAAQVGTAVLPSVAELARSTVVTGQVVRALGLPLSAAQLAGEASATTQRDMSEIYLVVKDPDPDRAVAAADAMAAELQRQAERLYPAGEGSLVHVSVLGSASPAKEAGRRLSHTGLLLVGMAAAALAMVFAGLAELRRPRIRSGRDVCEPATVPVVPLPAASGARDPAHRLQQLAILRSLIDSWTGRPDAARVAVFGVPGTAATRLVTDLRHAGRPAERTTHVVAVTEGGPISEAGPVDGVVVVADAQRATRDELARAVRAGQESGSPLLGVVVDGLLPRRARWRARLRAGVLGHGAWSRAIREFDGTGRRGDPPSETVPRVLAVLALAALGFSHVLPMGLSTGLLAAVVLLPLWVSVVRRSAGAKVLAVLAVLALVAGALLSWRASATHGFELHGALHTSVLVLTAVGGAGLILWARSVLSLPAIGVAYGAGLLLEGVLEVPASPNAWKFSLSVPVTIIALSLAARSPRVLPTLAAFGVMALMDVTHDYRSAFAFCALGAVLVLWQARPGDRPAVSAARPWMLFPALAVLGGLAYTLITRLLESGVLGAQLQQRTLAQIADSGSLLLSGRPEWAATWAFMRSDPLGFGLGVLPSAHDEVVARAGLAVTHVPTVGSYLDHQLFNGGIQLHSIVADLWSATGPAGAALGLAMGVLVVLGLGEQLLRRQASALVCWLVLQTLWSLAFGPLSSDAPPVILALGLLLTVRAARPAPATGLHRSLAGEIRQPVPAG